MQAILRPRATKATLVCSRTPVVYGEVVTFTATVTSGAGTPSGTVQFKDNGNNLAAPVALNSSGVVQFTTSTLAVGNHSITADYNGDANFATSTGTLSGGQVVKPRGAHLPVAIRPVDAGGVIVCADPQDVRTTAGIARARWQGN